MKPPAHTVALSPALRRLLVELQTWCTADCCKDGAFGITPEAVGRWLDGERIDRIRELAEEVARIAGGLPEADERVALDARGLGSDWDAADFLAFWGRLTAAFASAVAARKVADTEPGAAGDRRPHGLFPGSCSRVAAGP